MTLKKQVDSTNSTSRSEAWCSDLLSVLKASDRIHETISVMLKDWRDGDFDLPMPAIIHMEKLEEDYRSLGKALYAHANHKE